MSSEVDNSYNAGILNKVQGQVIGDFAYLLEALDGDSRYAAGTPENLARAVRSETTNVHVVREVSSGAVVSTATLSCLPTLTRRGTVAWIDDVVTLPRAQGNGLSRLTMDAMEAQAGSVSDKVSLTSGAERGPARAAYTKRSYELFPDGLAVYRNAELNKDRPGGTELLTNYSDADVEAMAQLLDEDPDGLELNMQSLLRATHSALLVHRKQGVVTALAVANLTPIPTGLKPWIDDIAGANHVDQLAVLGAAEQWIGQHGGLYANIVAASDDGLSEQYQQRSSGLFIKALASLES